MSKERIYYRDGYKYQLALEYKVATTVYPSQPVETEFLKLTLDGHLTVFAGYAWDGATGVVDSPDLIRGSLVHDALYQLIRLGLVSSFYKKAADRLLQKLCLEDGMDSQMAKLVYFAVTSLAGYATQPEEERKVLEAPPEEVVVVILFPDREAP